VWISLIPRGYEAILCVQVQLLAQCTNRIRLTLIVSVRGHKVPCEGKRRRLDDADLAKEQHQSITVEEHRHQSMGSAESGTLAQPRNEDRSLYTPCLVVAPVTVLDFLQVSTNGCAKSL
jgi:hypothetical protein